jgi:hypothetical protein
VRDFDGNAAYNEKKGFFARQNHGRNAWWNSRTAKCSLAIP